MLLSWSRRHPAMLPNPSHPNRCVWYQVVLDQSVFTVPSLMSTISAVTWAEQKPLEHVPARIRSQLWPLLKANWKVWGPTMCVVYAFVQEDLRPLVLNVVSIGWQIFYLMLLREPPKVAEGSTCDDMEGALESSTTEQPGDSGATAMLPTLGKSPSRGILNLESPQRSPGPGIKQESAEFFEMGYLPHVKPESVPGSPGVATSRHGGRGTVTWSRGNSVDHN